MIYLIGGAPKSGKTVIAEKLSRSRKVSVVSTDSLQTVLLPYITKENQKKGFPLRFFRGRTGRSNDVFYDNFSSTQIIKMYTTQARYVQKALENFIATEIADGNDIILEGYHIDPKFARKMKETYGKDLRAVFVGKLDQIAFLKNVHKGSGRSNWITKTKSKKGTLEKIAHTMSQYSQGFKAESKKYNMKFYTLDKSFNATAINISKYLIK